MYKKINTTRNSSFKKASIFIAVAAFASCAVFFGTERFNYNGEAASSVYASLYSSRSFGWNRSNSRRLFGPDFARKRYGKSYKLRDDRSLSDLTVGQKVNFDVVLKEAKIIIKQMQDRLTSLDNIPERITKFRVDGLGNIPKRVAEHIFDKFDVFRKLNSPIDDPYSVEELFGSMKDCLQGLIGFQDYLLEVIQSMDTLLEVDRIKDEDKKEELKNSDLAQLIKCPDELIKLVDIAQIREAGDSSVKKAKDIITTAKAAYFNATTFDGTDKYDPWATGWATNNADRRCYKLVATLQTLLYINQQINLVYDHVIASEIAENLQQVIKALYFSQTTPSVHATAAYGKTWIFKEFIENNRIDLLIMSLVLATVAKNPDSSTKAFKGVTFEGADKIKATGAEFAEQLANASKSGRQPRDLISRLKELISKAVDNMQTRGIEYDLKELFVDAVKEQGARELLRLLDDAILGVFSDGNVADLAAKLEQERGTDGQLADWVKLRQPTQRGNYPFDSSFGTVLHNSNSTSESPASKEAQLQKQVKGLIGVLQQHPDPNWRFVANAGQLNSALIAVPAAGEEPNNADMRLAIDVTKGAATVLSVPKMIRNAALIKLIIDKYDYNYNSTALLEDNLNSWFSITRFNSAVAEVVGKIQSIYSDSKKAIDKVSQVKSKEKSTKKTKEESRESKSGRSITNILSLDAGNRNSNRFAIKAQGKTIEVSNLASDVKKLSPVLCPKVSANSKEGDKNIDLPLVDVVDGKATIDLAAPLNAAGNYELHFRNAELDPATKNVVNYAFLLKSKIAYAANKTKPQSMCKITVEQADNSNLDFSTAEAILNEDKTVTYRVKAKSAASSNPEIMTGVCIKSNTTPNLEKDKFALQLASDKQTYSFTTNKGLEGNVELHVYNGEVEEGNYEGKIVAKTAETTEIESKEGTSIYSIIDKNPSSTSSAADGLTEITVQFVITDNDLYGILDPDSDYLDYEILDSSGKAVHSGIIDKLSKSSKKTRKGDNKYKVKIKVPKGGKEYTIRISSGGYADDMVLESFDRISSKTEINTEIGFRGVPNNWYKNWYKNWF